jgi:hypothetical protein
MHQAQRSFEVNKPDHEQHGNQACKPGEAIRVAAPRD